MPSIVFAPAAPPAYHIRRNVLNAYSPHTSNYAQDDRRREYKSDVDSRHDTQSGSHSDDNRRSGLLLGLAKRTARSLLFKRFDAAVLVRYFSRCPGRQSGRSCRDAARLNAKACPQVSECTHRQPAAATVRLTPRQTSAHRRGLRVATNPDIKDPAEKFSPYCHDGTVHGASVSPRFRRASPDWHR